MWYPEFDEEIPSPCKDLDMSTDRERLYLVGGASGTYEDYRTWSVCAYVNPDEAERHRERAQAWADAEDVRFQRRLDDWDGEKPVNRGRSPYDRQYAINAGEVHYYVEEVPTRTEAPNPRQKPSKGART